MSGMCTCLPCHIPDRWSRDANWIWPDLAFGFVHKSSGNEIINNIHLMIIKIVNYFFQPNDHTFFLFLSHNFAYAHSVIAQSAEVQLL